MKNKIFNIISAGSLLLAACSANVSVTPDPGTGTNSGKPVTFNIKIDKTVFSDKAELTLALYDSAQLKISESTAGCTVSFDTTTQKETVNCPAGVVYQKPNPETYKYKIAEISDSISVKSTTVTTGENYRLQVSGLSRDNCNQAAATVQERAAGETVNINNPEWATTAMACLP